VLRSAGPRLGILTLAGDTLKGVLPTLLASRMAPGMDGPAGLAAVLGHVFPVWLGFRGGKGVATALGVLVVLEPGAAAVGVAVFVATVLTTRYVSLASIVATIAAAALACVAGKRGAPYALVIAVLIVARHAGNLRRLLAGTEPRLTRPGSRPG
jgi:glycerol-3-phosphate acyltransferase PlsY